MDMIKVPGTKGKVEGKESVFYRCLLIRSLQLVCVSEVYRMILSLISRVILEHIHGPNQKSTTSEAINACLATLSQKRRLFPF